MTSTFRRRVLLRLAFLPTVVLALVFVPGKVSTLLAADPFAEQRQKMVDDYLVDEGISNRRVLDALRTVPRHEFVDAKYRSQSYIDTALPIGHQQTISPPFVVAYMTETLDPQPEDRVLEIGTGSGYQAAVLGQIVREVYSIEIVPQLGRDAERLLKRLKFDNVHTKVGDGYLGWPEHAPFDKIIVTCSPENVPRPLIEQLREGGKMIVPLGERYQQVFYLFEKTDGKLVTKKLIPTLFVPMTGQSENLRQVQPDPLHPKIVNGGFEDDENNDGRVDGWHYQRQVKLDREVVARGANAVCFENSEPGRLSQMLQGFPVDGREVKALEISLRVQANNIGRGTGPTELPALVVHFYDSIRRPAGEAVLGPWRRDTEDWEHVSKTVRVPGNAREAIVRIGLNGATGTFRVDDVQMTPK